MADIDEEKSDQIANTIIEQMEPLTDKERLHVFSRLGDAYCEGCGRVQPDRGCYCRRDD